MANLKHLSIADLAENLRRKLAERHQLEQELLPPCLRDELTLHPIDASEDREISFASIQALDPLPNFGCEAFLSGFGGQDFGECGKGKLCKECGFCKEHCLCGEEAN